MRPLLVTAGATRNPIDAMRFISARSTGRTGVGIAQGQRGDVHVLCSPEAAARAHDLSKEVFGSTRDLQDRVRSWVTLHPDGVVVHAAAVGDYESAPEAGKIPSGQAELVLTLRPAPKILDQIVRWSSSVSVVSFKAAPPGTDHQALAKICASQLQRTQSIAVFGNTIGQLSTHSMLVTAEGPQRFTSRADALGALGALVTAIRARATSEAE